MMIAVAKSNGEEQINRAMVSDLYVPDMGIMCERNEYGNWEALFVIVEPLPGVGIGIKKDIPPCFILPPEAIDALENPWLLDGGEET